MVNEKMNICNRCSLPKTHPDCNNLIKGNKCLAIEKPDFTTRCPFYKSKDDTKARDMKYHQAELVGVEVWCE